MRLLIAPANFAGQGFAWARAVERYLPSVTAVAVETGHGELTFPHDYFVPQVIANGDPEWGKAQFNWVVSTFTHVLLEAARPVFGLAFAGEPKREISALRDAGIEVALMAHGTDVRLPSAHAAREPWSPFHDDMADRSLRQSRTIAALEVFHDFSGPRFVSTPDLHSDVAGATWCPVVVPRAGEVSVRFPERGLTRVLHIPSNGPMKGSDLIDPVMDELHDAGVLKYMRVAHVPSAQMPALYSMSDVVLDQFRIGSYGVAACEGMARGKVVVGHVADHVRALVHGETGMELPVVEATPATLAGTLRALVSDRPEMSRLSAAGVQFASEVHDGQRSAQALRSWLLGAP